jgi:hypothetical protein
MNWIVLSYSLPAKPRSSLRVSAWRRLRRLGVVSLAGGSHVLPARDECVEAFQWLAQELRQARGDALVMHVDQFEDMTDQQLVDLFHAARKEDYAALETEVSALEKAAASKKKLKDLSQLQDDLGRLRRRYAEIARVDYFACPDGSRVAAQLARVEQALSPDRVAPMRVPPVSLSEYRNKRWTTRPRPHVDRLACAWLIRRFIDPKARIRYAARPQVGEIGFDMDGGRFGHEGNLCTFETMQQAFGFDDPALRAMAEIVHEIDLRDGRYTRPETTGIDAILRGWLVADLSDAELEVHGVALFEGMYAALSSGVASKSK